MPTRTRPSVAPARTTTWPREVKAVREAVGCIEIANYSKHRFEGPGARAFLDRVLAGRVPKPGRIALTPMLTEKGKLYGDLTVACLAKDRFMLVGSGAMQEAHRRWFEQRLGTGVDYQNLSDALHGIALSGPRARDLLARISRDDVSAEAFRFRDIRQTFVGGGACDRLAAQLLGRARLRDLCRAAIPDRAGGRRSRTPAPIWGCAGTGRGR